MNDKPKTIIIGNGFTGLTEAFALAARYQPMEIVISPQIKGVIESQEKPLKMYNETKGLYGLFPNMIKTTYKTLKADSNFNKKKHLATCAKNRRKRKSKKRKNK